MTQSQGWHRAIKLAVIISSVAILTTAAGLRSTVLAQQAHSNSTSGRGPVYSGSGLVYGGPTCPSPPVGFDPLAAPLADLQYYGLPARPNGGSAAVADWVDLVHHAQHRVCGLGNPNTHQVSHPGNISRRGYAGLNSDYWAGYVATTGGYDWAWANWYVPLYTNPSPLNATAVQWVGLGGFFGDNLWQGGTETDDRAGFTFWWEMVPGGGQQFQGPTVHPGNLVRVGVDYNQTCSGKSYMQMANYSTNVYWSPPCQSFKPSASAVEWIDERTSCGLDRAGNPLVWALANFQHTNWSYAQAESTYYGNQIEPISFYANDAITMVDNYYPYQTLAYPSSLGADGKSFTDTWTANGTATCQ